MRSSRWLALWLLSAVCLAEPSRDLISLSASNPSELARLSSLLSDIKRLPQSDLIHAYASDEEQAKLQAAGIAFQLDIDDLSTYYAQRAARDLQRRTANPNASMAGFRTFAEIENTLDWLAQTFPHLISDKFSLGKSDEGRELWAIRISDNPNSYETEEATVWFDALHHAREPMSGEALLRFAYYLASQYSNNPAIQRLIHSRNLILLPCSNPDGYEYNRRLYPNGGGLWRKNRRDNGDGSYGVDLNRNYAWQWGGQSHGSDSELYAGERAFSEPETAAIADFLKQQTPRVSVSVHSYGNEWMYPWGYTQSRTVADASLRYYAEPIAAQSGFVSGSAWDLYGASYGASDDYHYGAHDSLAYTVEIGSYADGFWPTPSRIPVLFAAVAPGFETLSQAAGAWVQWLAPQWQELQGNGDAWFDAGEQWRLLLGFHNHGRADLSATARLLSSVGIELDKTDLALHLAAHQQGGIEAITVDFSANLTSNTPLSLQLSLSYEGVHSVLNLPLYLGAAQGVKQGAFEPQTVPVLVPTFMDEEVQITMQTRPNTTVQLFAAWQGGTADYYPEIATAVYLKGQIYPLAAMQSDDLGKAVWHLPMPNDDSLFGRRLYLQALLIQNERIHSSQMLTFSLSPAN